MMNETKEKVKWRRRKKHKHTLDSLLFWFYCYLFFLSYSKSVRQTVIIIIIFKFYSSFQHKVHLLIFICRFVDRSSSCYQLIRGIMYVRQIYRNFNKKKIEIKWDCFQNRSRNCVRLGKPVNWATYNVHKHQYTFRTISLVICVANDLGCIQLHVFRIVISYR